MTDVPPEAEGPIEIDPDDFSGIPDAELDEEDLSEVEAMWDAHDPEDWHAMRGTLTREERAASESDAP